MSKQASKLHIIAFITAASMALTLVLHHGGALQALENMGYDWRMKVLRSDVQAPDDVAVIMIDEASLGAMDPLVGRWPWPRSVHADVIDFLALGGPRAIVFDILLSEADSAAEDQRLAVASAEAGNVIHAMQLYRDTEDPTNRAILARPLPADALPHALPGSGAEDDNNAYTLPLPALAQASAGLGVVTTEPDADGIYRSIRLWHGYQGRRFPSLGSAPLPWQRFAQHGARQRINYYGHIASYSMSGVLASAQQLFDGQVEGLLVDPYEFEDKIVYIGASAVGLEDLKATPLAANTPGVMIHAAVTANLLSGDLLKTPPATLTLVTIGVATLLVCALVLGVNALWLKVTLPLLCLAAYVSITFLAFRENLVLSMAPPLLAMSLGVVFSTIYLLFTEGRDKRRVRNMLGQYVSPAVLSMALEAYEDHLDAEVGSEEELSILFSDIRGFTSLSETMPPNKVVEMLNHYFSAMTETIFAQRGTIDKFIGDAIMAFWGAPVREAQHAELALGAAMEMHRRLKDVNLWLQAHDYPALQIGIGIHSGPVILGNIGSVQKLDYTVIGDNVNLASRLEGLTKQYGVTILISEATYNQLQEPPPCYTLDLVRVKGKQVPIRIYAPILEADGASARQQAQLCRRAFDAYLAQQWQTAIELYRQLPEGVLGETFIQRCRSYQQQPPPPDWDGVFTMTSK